MRMRGGDGERRLLGEQVDVGEGEWCCRIDSSLVLAIRERFVGGWGALVLPPWTFGSAGSLERPTNSETRLLDVELYFFIWEGVFF
jgi:hypothetical protein